MIGDYEVVMNIPKRFLKNSKSLSLAETKRMKHGDAAGRKDVACRIPCRATGACVGGETRLYCNQLKSGDAKGGIR